MIDRQVRARPLALGAVLAALVLAGCASPTNRAPVEDRSPVAARPAVTAATPATVPDTGAAAAPAVPAAPVVTAPAVSGAIASPVASGTEPGRTPPGIENLGKPGYYAVKPGDTLVRIALESGQNWRDIVRWNNLADANVIEVGQVLRVVPPATAVAAARPAEPLPRPAVPGGPAAPPATTPPATTPPAAGATAAASPAAAPPATTAAGDDDIRWAWPASGPVVASFDEGRTKGLSIGGRAGDPVVAAADGRVVYAGSGLRGYGNLVIVKHNNTFLTAYAHNQALLVKEDQMVRRGQKIAEMGSTDADRVQLHFEIRRQGRPVDPARLLPAR
ncbi:MAG: peptidoglycan DD-metalloendopeptidase family protein [Ideonella sp.]|nr:peptidoglycan DD-metalloendopeptidase family protein [Ideonella sp.]